MERSLVKTSCLLLSFVLTVFHSFSQKKFKADSLLKVSLPQYAEILNNPVKYKIQFIYTQINRDEKNIPSFKTYKAFSNSRYFYPASTVKLPVTVATLIKIEELKSKGINLNSPMLTDSAWYCQKKVFKDTTSSNGYPTAANYLKKMWLVSDNYSCSRLYEFVGCDYLHKKMEENGFSQIRIPNRLDAQCPGDTAKVTPPVYFLNASGDTVYKQALTFSNYNKQHPIEKSLVGKYHRDAYGKKRTGPKDFSKHNYLALADLHEMMRRMVFNPYLKEEDKLPINEEDRLFVIKQAGMMPKESEFPKYNKKDYYDSYKKYFMYGSAVATITGDSIRIFNIVGRAYGFLIDCAYIVDFKNKTEFLLTASIYVNKRNDIGGGRYEYELLGLPFLRDASMVFYNYERRRVKVHPPDLKEFNIFGFKE